jgi:hypothetical protein
MAKPETTDPRDYATTWFAVLERAKLANDFERAAEAVRQLKRLGVEVKFIRRPEVPSET